MAIIRGLAKEGMTMVSVTHEMGFARKVTDRVFVMDDGLMVEEVARGASSQIPGMNGQKLSSVRFCNFLFLFSIY